MSLFMGTPDEVGNQIRCRAQAKRLILNLTQKSLSDRSGVSFGVIKRFERTGKISFESLLKLAVVLNSLEKFKELFGEPSPTEEVSLDRLLKDKSRKRGRQ
ncbi:MAG: helix-turn-helix transcriptional regulator [Alphaproteobacteria bacterium]